MSNGICFDDIDLGLVHVSSLASELHDELIEFGREDLAAKAERLAYFSWFLSRASVNINQEGDSFTRSIRN
ncbi:MULTISPECIES: hypothetical protein [Vibrio]|uniref:Uncharacterized protein n=1 Tax=Vibrio aestuarianus TaxID=28171 RepID=A0ABD7YQB0_9VIBR|nr:MULTISPECIES: hypothetical protein [Vibrio]AUB89565.1 hypothetical protein CKX99_02105 [Vibrio anguillarum]AUB93007.1 hypothetical protein CK210_02105 [Vibrio anguillarum]AUB96439.1 hypothetical protein CK209_02105 [Vibrio anguillarum]AXM53287.1 hypothetical protein DD758_02020 [Vibrio anguillarum]AXM59839.1 hypothetical protein DD731_02015 [Vibrio anguillarum]